MKIIDDARPPFKGCVYAITNLVTWQTYVGATAGSAWRRISLHANALRRQRGVSKVLQADWDAYGEEAFIGGLIESVESAADLPARESFWLAEMEKRGISLYNQRRSNLYPEVVAQAIAETRTERERLRAYRRRRSEERE